MTEKKPKKLYMHYILEVLKKHTDEEHRISQQKIADLVLEDYGMKLDRKTVRHNLSMLLEADYPLVYTERHRTNKRGVQENILTDWYFRREHKWDESELCVMIDSLLFSNYLPKNQCDRLVMKKKHPCGSNEMLVLRSGMDFKLRCAGCGREFMIPRSKAEKNVKTVIREAES